MNNAELERMTREIMTPKLLGRVKVGQSPSGIFCFGCIIDSTGVLITGIFGGRAVEMDGFLASMKLTGMNYSCPDGSGGEAHFTVDFPNTHFEETRDSDRQEPLVLCINKAAMKGEELDEIGGVAHVYLWGRKDDDEPIMDLFSEMMQDTYSMPLAPEWHTVLWQKLVRQDMVVKAESYGLEGTVYEVMIDTNAWHQLVFSSLDELPRPEEVVDLSSEEVVCPSN